MGCQINFIISFSSAKDILVSFSAWVRSVQAGQCQFSLFSVACLAVCEQASRSVRHFQWQVCWHVSHCGISSQFSSLFGCSRLTGLSKFGSNRLPLNFLERALILLLSAPCSGTWVAPIFQLSQVVIGFFIAPVKLRWCYVQVCLFAASLTPPGFDSHT